MQIVGNQDSWHIRLIQQVGHIELWQLWCGDSPESSLFDRATVETWMREEIAKGEN